MLKWLTFDGIVKEVKRIRWPKTKEVTDNVGEVLMFVIFFGLFFVACELLISFMLRFAGIGA